MKIAIPTDCYDAAHEYVIYSYLNAINNTQVEVLGIPSVYYYGRWNNCILLAITLLDSEFSAMTKKPKTKFNDFDILIIFREFVSNALLNKFCVWNQWLGRIMIIKQSFDTFYTWNFLQVRITKYIHSRGICHMDTQIGNFMFREQKGFLIGKSVCFLINLFFHWKNIPI